MCIRDRVLIAHDTRPRAETLAQSVSFPIRVGDSVMGTLSVMGSAMPALPLPSGSPVALPQHHSEPSVLIAQTSLPQLTDFQSLAVPTRVIVVADPFVPSPMNSPRQNSAPPVFTAHTVVRDTLTVDQSLSVPTCVGTWCSAPLRSRPHDHSVWSILIP